MLLNVRLTKPLPCIAGKGGLPGLLSTVIFSILGFTPQKSQCSEPRVVPGHWKQSPSLHSPSCGLGLRSQTGRAQSFPPALLQVFIGGSQKVTSTVPIGTAE